MQHTFVICAYKKSEYLEKCILSLKKQKVRSSVIMVTSTPSDFLMETAEKHNIPLFINEGEGGITQDWNFGLSKVNTPYATIAHQDDIYLPDYTGSCLERMKSSEKPLIAFTDYFEIRDGKKVLDDRLLKVKRLMLLPMRPKAAQGSRFIRRRVLSFGDPVCCPSVMYSMKNLKFPVFRNHYRSVEDWEAWEKISRMKGDFLYINRPLVGHRIHHDSETSKIIHDGKRVRENYEMYRKFWPPFMAKLINYFYTSSEKSNEL